MNEALRELQELADVITALRDPKTGCPWDLEQNLETLTRFMNEEASEYVSAVAGGNPADMADELGDVLLQVFLNAKIAEQQQLFDLATVARGIKEKMIRRHPHVFGNHNLRSAEEVKKNWEKIKQQESPRSPVEKLFQIPQSLNGLQEAEKIGRCAENLNFDWQDAHAVFAKVEEELAETAAELAHYKERADDEDAAIKARLEHEIGDLFFATAQLARKLNINPELAIKKCNQRFYRRFQSVAKQVVESGKDFKDCSSAEMEAFWQEAKRQEKT